MFNINPKSFLLRKFLLVAKLETDKTNCVFSSNNQSVFLRTKLERVVRSRVCRNALRLHCTHVGSGNEVTVCVTVI